MKKTISWREVIKVMFIYAFVYALSYVLSNRFVRYDYLLPYLKNYKYVVLSLTLSLIILFTLFKVSFRYIVRFYAVISFFLLFVFINLNIFVTLRSTPDYIIFEILTIAACFITYPFLSIIQTLVGYQLEGFSYLVVPMYILLMCLTSYSIYKVRLKLKFYKLL